MISKLWKENSTCNNLVEEPKVVWVVRILSPLEHSQEGDSTFPGESQSIPTAAFQIEIQKAFAIMRCELEMVFSGVDIL